MSKVPILNSPFLTLGVLDTALSGETDPAIRIQLLSAKVHLLESERDKAAATATAATSAGPSSSTSSTTNTSSTIASGSTALAESPSQSQGGAGRRRRHRPDPTALLSARVILADTYLALVPPNLHAAEGECAVVEGECKRLMKVAKRLDRRDQPTEEREGREGGSKTDGGEEEERPDWLDEIPHLRVRALRVMARVEEGLGRDGRAERTRKLAQEIADQR